MIFIKFLMLLINLNFEKSNLKNLKSTKEIAKVLNLKYSKKVLK